MYNQSDRYICCLSNFVLSILQTLHPLFHIFTARWFMPNRRGEWWKQEYHLGTNETGLSCYKSVEQHGWLVRVPFLIKGSQVIVFLGKKLNSSILLKYQLVPGTVWGVFKHAKGLCHNHDELISINCMFVYLLIL